MGQPLTLLKDEKTGFPYFVEMPQQVSDLTPCLDQISDDGFRL